MRQARALSIVLLATASALAGEIRLETEDGVLFGTLEVPDGEGRPPVVLIHPGSGPTDADGNNPLAGRNNSLRYLAEGLLARGIASLRIDKRGIGRSASAMPSEADLRFDDYIADTVAWVERLRADGRFSKVVILGHSEGSTIGMIAAREAGADAYVSVAGPGFPGDKTLREQLGRNLPPALASASFKVIDELKAGRTVDDPPQALAGLFRKSVQPYLISWLARDPREEIARLEVPVLILHGDTDIQIAVDEAEALAAAHEKAELVLVEGMNHVLKLAPADPAQQQAAYADPDLPVAPKLIESIAAFVARLGD